MNFPPPSQRQARAIWFALTAFAVAVVVALLAVLIWGLGRALGLWVYWRYFNSYAVIVS